MVPSWQPQVCYYATLASLVMMLYDRLQEGYGG